MQHEVVQRRAGTHSGRMGPGSAAHHCVLRRARDRISLERDMTASLRLRAGLVSIVLLAGFLGIWHLAKPQ